MSLAEICSRLADSWSVRRNRGRFQRGELFAANGTAISQVASRLLPRAINLVPGATPAQWLELTSFEPELAKRILHRCRQRSSEVLEGTVEFLGHRLRLTLPIDWHGDPRTSYRFPRRFYADVQLYELPEGVDVKYVWELNRHEWLVDLARAWRLEGNMRAATFARDALLSWIDQNPYGEGVNWTSGLEVGIRAICWLWTVALSGDASCWQEEDWELVVGSLAQHAHFLENHLSYYSSPYNHLVGEATALLLLGYWLASMPGADNWVKVGRQVLEKHGPKQFYEDGFSVEQATGYHFFTLGFLFQAALIGRSMGESLTAVERILPAALKAGASMCQPDGRWPVIGDVDGARSIPVFFEDFWDFRSLCSLGAVLCHDASAKHLAGQPGEEIFWLLGCEGVRAWQELPSQPPEKTTILPDAGYFVATSRDKRDWLLFDAGPLGDGVHHDGVPSVAHGHADALSLLLFWQGRSTLVDSGIPAYSGPLSEVDYYRSSAAHSTFEILGQPIARGAGRLAWNYVHRRPEASARLNDQLWVARACLKLAQGSIMERFILAIPGEGIWIADRVQTKHPCTAAWYWQLLETLNPNLAGHECEGTRLNFENGTIFVQTNGTQVQATLDLPGTTPVAWQAPVYGTKRPGRRFTVTAGTQGDLLVLTSLGKGVLTGHVTLGNASIGDSRLSTEAFPDCIVPPGEITWRVESSSGPRIIVAGTTRTEIPQGWTPISGAGNWSVMERKD